VKNPPKGSKRYVPPPRGPPATVADVAVVEPLKPTTSLLCKLGSIVVHAEEGSDPITGHSFDIYAIRSLLSDPEVRSWLAAMRKLALIPEKR
jgi:hypothetical protein